MLSFKPFLKLVIPFNIDIVESKPFGWIRFGSIYGLSILNGFSVFLHNIYEKILLHPGPLTGFVSDGRTDCT